ncbi:hypothetical protein LshimejAT787_1303260 [Lyophyllum shimeji]|uniref:Uncharacterized protein n=1 Tax=Lyophyllum shimeji TaxID=47721 RepID=A0A9P3PV02_LYOSH|nr:hypothetical protein LshimejAT787_1303260 [Lyophyllum shimeji]
MASSVPFTVRRWENPSEAEVERLVELLRAALGEDDPFSDMLVGGDRSLVSAQLEMSVRAGALGGELHVASLGKEFVGGKGVAKAMMRVVGDRVGKDSRWINRSRDLNRARRSFSSTKEWASRSTGQLVILGASLRGWQVTMYQMIKTMKLET